MDKWQVPDCNGKRLYFLHGNPSRKINELYKEAKIALEAGNLTKYSELAAELMKVGGVKAPGGVLVGYSEIAAGIDHTFLVAAKEGAIKARGYDAHPLMKPFAHTNKWLIGVVKDESATLSIGEFKFLTSDLGKVQAVWENMDKVRPIIYKLDNTAGGTNCYGWRNAVLKQSGMEPPRDLPWAH